MANRQSDIEKSWKNAIKKGGSLPNIYKDPLYNNSALKKVFMTRPTGLKLIKRINKQY